ncbi:hypothetical protein I553_4379 [Mycobacterium xenopi 4042]|uniref:Uncharacterized protein n=1 Tax=Mycobacterium xenopi 4042 TaxID=1299334 RepID=X8AGH9_MYCXE|nr:hypothetical protein I553_4379 [Mycobacterium xenopi 4042]
MISDIDEHGVIPTLRRALRDHAGSWCCDEPTRAAGGARIRPHTYHDFAL